MTDTDARAQDAAPPDSEAPRAPSLLERLRAQRNDNVDGRTTLRDVPGWRGVLVCRYRFVPYRELADVVPRIQRGMFVSDKADLAPYYDLLIRACDEVLGRDRDGSLERLSNDPEPVRYDARLMEALARTPSSSTARAAVFEAFRHNDHDVVVEAIALYGWLQSLEDEADDDALGE